MGDQVQRFLEQMVPELEDYRKKDLFDRSEIKSIVNKRTDFEYKLVSRVPKIMDYLRYVQYEMNLDGLRKKRKAKYEKMKAGPSDYAAIRRISFIYERCLRKFNNRVDVWLQYIEYCRESGSVRSLNKIFPKALQFNPLVPRLWIECARFEFHGNQNVTAARVMLQRGLRLNPDAKEIWLAFGQMEIEYIQRLRERKRQLGLVRTATRLTDEGGVKQGQGDGPSILEAMDLGNEDGEGEGEEVMSLRTEHDSLDENDREFLTGAIPKAIFRNAIMKKALVDDFRFRLEFAELIPESKPVPVLGEEETTTKKKKKKKKKKGVSKEAIAKIISHNAFVADLNVLRDLVWDSLSRDFPRQVEVWALRATRACELDRQTDLSVVERRACSLFETGLQEGNAGSCVAMWVEYIHFLYERLTDSDEISLSRDFLLVRLVDVFERAMEDDCMTEELFALRVSFLLQNGDQTGAEEALEEGLQEARFPAAPGLWALHLHIQTTQYGCRSAQPLSENGGQKKKRKRASDSSSDGSATAAWPSLLMEYERALAAMPEEKRGPVFQQLLPLVIERAANKHLNSPASRACHAWFIAAVSANVRGGAETGDGDAQTQQMERFVCWYIEWVVSAAVTYSVKKSNKRAKGSAASKGGRSCLDAVEAVKKVVAWVTGTCVGSISSPVIMRKCIEAENTTNKLLKVLQITLKQTSLNGLQEASRQQHTRVRGLYEMAMREMGQHHPDMWFEWILFDQSRGAMKEASATYWRALKDLAPQYHEGFSARYQSI